MSQLISEWTDYCEGKTKQDESDFIGLLAKKCDDDDLSKIFRLVPGKNAVIDNLKRIYQCTEDEPGVYLRTKRENAATSDELKSIVARFIDSQRRYLLKHDIDEETRVWLERSDLEISFVSTEQLRTLVDPNDDVIPFVFQEEVELRNYRQDAGFITTAESVRVMSGIREALYGLASDYYLQWYVLSPILDTEIDYGLYFDFWRKGGEYALTDSQILVASVW